MKKEKKEYNPSPVLPHFFLGSYNCMIFNFHFDIYLFFMYLD